MNWLKIQFRLWIYVANSEPSVIIIACIRKFFDENGGHQCEWIVLIIHSFATICCTCIFFIYNVLLMAGIKGDSVPNVQLGNTLRTHIVLCAHSINSIHTKHTCNSIKMAFERDFVDCNKFRWIIIGALKSNAFCCDDGIRSQWKMMHYKEKSQTQMKTITLFCLCHSTEHHWACTTENGKLWYESASHAHSKVYTSIVAFENTLGELFRIINRCR